MKFRLAEDDGFFGALYNAMPLPVFIVDDDMRILEYNRAASSLFAGEPEKKLKMRGGDTLNCIYSKETPEGCGHSEACKTCVIRNSVKRTSENREVVRQRHRMQLEAEGTVRDSYLYITTVPFAYKDNLLILLILEDITELTKAEVQIKQQKEFLSLVLDSLPHPFYVINANDYSIHVANRASVKEGLIVNSTCYAIAHHKSEPCHDPEHCCPLPEVKRTRKPVVLEHKHSLPGGESRNYEVHAYPILDEKENVVQMIEYSLDITERKGTERALMESEKRYRSLFENMLEGSAYCRMLFEDNRPQDFIYLAVNSSFERLTGLKDVVGKKVTEAIPGIRESYPELFEIYGRVALTGRTERFELYLEPLRAWLSIAVYSTEREYLTAVFDNITERKKAEEELKEVNRELEALSITDGLTGLSNSRHFYTGLKEEMQRAKRYSRPFSVVIADVDCFKHYNDAHGHLMGDNVLKDIASCLKACMRENDIVARYGGEEFSIILPETGKEAAKEIAERIRKMVSDQAFPYEESQPGGNLTISLGVATFPDDAADIKGLVGLADIALYRAKENGRNSIAAA